LGNNNARAAHQQNREPQETYQQQTGGHTMTFYILSAIAVQLLTLKTILGAGSTSRVQIHIQKNHLRKITGARQ